MEKYLDNLENQLRIKKKVSKESIIGLGEDSFRKNYYPELQEKIMSLEEINLRNKALMEAIPDVLFVSDFEGRLTPFASSLKGKKPLMSFMLEDEHALSIIQSCVQKVVDQQVSAANEFRMNYQDEEMHFEVRAHKTDLEEILVIVRDMTERVELINKLKDIALKDTLTGVYNRYFFEEKLKTYEDQKLDNLVLLLIDIDGLKIVNDTLGHLAGDELIKLTSKFILESVHEKNLVSRIGGDEFGVVLDTTTLQQIEDLITLIQTKADQYNDDDIPIKLSLSYGYSFHENGVVDTRFMYQQADNNMYQNKLLKTSSNRNYVVKSLMKALEARDYITEGHADRMGEMAVRMGKALHLTSVQLNRIELLAKFHDIGKVGIPDLILKKPAKLTKSEFEIMKTHTQIGERIAKESGELREIAGLILKHHERYDGYGYPLQLKGEDIPVECRILSIVDAYDAMTNDRPYRKALSQDVAYIEISNCSGSQFDPHLVEIFFRIQEN